MTSFFFLYVSRIIQWDALAFSVRISAAGQAGRTYKRYIYSGTKFSRECREIVCEPKGKRSERECVRLRERLISWGTMNIDYGESSSKTKVIMTVVIKMKILIRHFAANDRGDRRERIVERMTSFYSTR